MTAKRCDECGRTLTNRESIKNGCGPVCAEKRATNITAIGSAFGISAESWASFEQTNERQATLAYKAFKQGKLEHVKVFLRAARIAA